jgi:hypothetical protein
MPDRRAGIAFQNLVAAIERSLSAQPGASLLSPAYVTDTGGRRREHDILITHRRGHHTILTAIECKDRSRKIGLPDLEAFAEKCTRTGIHHGVIVSSSGFTQSALEDAPKLNLQCLDLATFEAIGNQGQMSAYLRETKLLEVEMVVHPTTTGRPPFQSFLQSGEIFDQKRADKIIYALLAEQGHPDAGLFAPARQTLMWKDPDIVAIDSDGQTISISKVEFAVCFIQNQSPAPFSIHNYTGSGRRFDVMSFDTQESKVVLVWADDGLRVSKAPQPPGPTTSPAPDRPA